MESNADTLQRWLNDPVAFVEEACVCPETGQLYELYPAQKTFFREALTPAPSGAFPYSELLFSCCKKSGKSTTGALAMLYAIFTSGDYSEGVILANDKEQAHDRIYQQAANIIQASPLLRSAATIGQSRIYFPSTHSTITAISSDSASAAGSNPTFICADEAWGFVSEGASRLLDEVIVSPTRGGRSARLITTYAGYAGESTFLESLYARGIAGEEIAPDLYRSPGMLCFWSHDLVSPWQTPEWVEEMRRTLRPTAFTRLILNQFASSESEFIPIVMWDNCVRDDVKPIASRPGLPIFVGVDASYKRDSTALVAVTLTEGLLTQAYERYDHYARIPDIARLQQLEELNARAAADPMVHLVNHAIFQPAPGRELDFELTVERVLLEWSQKYTLAGVVYDPYQLVALAQRLSRLGLPMIEYPQTIPSTVEFSSNLFEMLKSQTLVLYRDGELRQSVQWCVGKETPRGVRIVKEKTSHKIDAIIALSMAALAAVRYGPSWFEFNRSASGEGLDVTNLYGR